MSGIDAVIARSRQPGAMSSRKRFTISRKRAIQKLRQFALADPHAYILELIQAAIANGAVYVDIQTSRSEVTLSYVGGGLSEEELAQIFDFLFASKDRADVRDLRALALGLNAALRFVPDVITVESGDGTPKGTTRMVLRPGSDGVEVGKPETPLAGTYVRIEGMSRSALGKAWKRSFPADVVREVGLIESRCRTAPVPIVIDGDSLFGFGSQRIPSLPGYRKTLAIDEGDLYGVIGIDPAWGKASFQLLTYGVHVQSKTRMFAPRRPVGEATDLNTGGSAIGGIICFDALHKTVDHSGIVEDARYEEMWGRIWPYVGQLSSGSNTGRSPYEAFLLGHDEALAIPTLRDLLIHSPRVVLVDRADKRHALAAPVGRALDAPVICAARHSFDDLRALGGEDLELIRPHLGAKGDLSFFALPALGPPPRPWVVESVRATAMSMVEVMEGLTGVIWGDTADGEDLLKARLQDALGTKSPLVDVYLPDLATGAEPTRLEVRACDRLIASCLCPEFPDGRVIVVEFPECSPARLNKVVAAHEKHSGSSWCEVLIEVFAESLEEAVGAIGDSVLSRLVKGAARTPTSRCLGLDALSDKMLPVINFSKGKAAIELWSLAGKDVGLDIELLARHAAPEGRELSCGLNQLCEQINAGTGLIYATTPEVGADLVGLDLTRVLKLETGQEKALLTLFGDIGYVRVDVREVLARAGDYVVRDRAPGIEKQPGYLLAVESTCDQARPYDESLEQALVEQLLKRARGQLGDRPRASGASEDWEVCRREAAGHLRAYVCMALESGRPDALKWSQIGLFHDIEGELWSLEELVKNRKFGPLVCVHGNPDERGVAGLSEIGEGKKTKPAAALVVDLFTARQLERVIDFTTTPHQAAGQSGEFEELEASVELASGARARLRMLAKDELNSAAVVLRREGASEVVSRMLAARYGVRGVIDMRRSQSEGGALVAGASRALWMQALAELRVDGISEAPGLRLAELALRVVSNCMQVILTESRGLRFTIKDSLAQELAALPLFELRLGGRISASGLIRRANRLASQDPREALDALLSSECPAGLRAWLSTAFDPSRAVVQRHFEYEKLVEEASSIALPFSDHSLGCSIRSWINVLRPDSGRLSHCFVTYPESGMGAIEGGSTSVRLSREDKRIVSLLDVQDAASTKLSADFARILLAVYGCMNYYASTIDLEHELVFQSRVLHSLRQGHLHALRPPVPQELRYAAILPE